MNNKIIKCKAIQKNKRQCPYPAIINGYCILHYRKSKKKGKKKIEDLKEAEG